jgi:predicted nucleic acid-binding protein
MKILFDTNVVLDVMLLRKPFYKPATHLMIEVENNNIDGYLCSTTVTTLHYLISKLKGRKEAKARIENLLNIFNPFNDMPTLETKGQVKPHVHHFFLIHRSKDCIVLYDNFGST